MSTKYIGLAFESQFNQEPAPEATIHLDAASSSLDTPADTHIKVPGGIGRTTKKKKSGFYIGPNGNIAYAFDLSSLRYLLKATLGGYRFTDGGAGLNKHEFYGIEDNILPSLFVEVGKDFFEHRFHGCVSNSLDLEVNGELCMGTSELNCARDSILEQIKDLSQLLLPPYAPLAYYQVTAKINGVDISAITKDFKLNVANNLSPDAGKTIGSRFTRRIPAGERTTTITANLLFNSLEYLKKYWGGTTGPTENSEAEEFSMEFYFDGGAEGNMKVILPRVYISATQQQINGREEITQALTITAMSGAVNLLNGSTINTDIYVVVNCEQEAI
jgi:hypothetical protein